MTQTCTTCHDPDCPAVGQDVRACEHYVRLSDVEPEPEPEPASRTDEILNDLSERVDLIAAGQMQTMQTVQTMQMQWDDLWAAVLKVRAGEGL